MEKLEKRSYLCEVRAAKEDADDGVIIGRPIVFEQKTDIGPFDETIARGALDKADLTDVRFLVNHDISKIPLARSRRNNGNSTMDLSVDDDGMGIEVRLDTENNAEAKSLYSAVKRQDVTGMSFMFSVKDDEWQDIDSEHPTRIIKAIRSVVEVSAVTFPAYESTEIYARNKEALESAKTSLESARQKRAASLESELELEKLKIEVLGGIEQ